MSTLHERLADLAHDAPAVRPEPALWDRARRHHRRRRTGNAAVVAVTVLALGLIGGIGWLRADDGIEPAAPGADPALPDRVWKPSRWLPGTDDEGPLGQLAMLQSAERAGWTSAEFGVVGISATTGEYRFLDLPDVVAASVDEVALSPDGRRVAYWYTGETDEVANEEVPVVGAAVYDATTGEVTRMPVATDHGLSSGDLTWVDDERLVLDWAQYLVGADGPSIQQGGARGAGVWTWTPGQDRGPARLVDGGAAPGVLATSGTGVLLLSYGNGSVGVLDLDEGAVDRFRLPGLPGFDTVAVAPSGDRVAWPRGRKNPNDLHVGDLTSGAAVESNVVPGTSNSFAARQWLDERRVAVVRRVPGGGIGPSALFSVDVRTGEQVELVRLPRNSYGSTVEIATSLLYSPTVERPRPADPWDPRLQLGLAVCALLLGGFSLWVWRRVAQP